MSDIIEKLREYAQHAETRSERDTFEATINEITILREDLASAKQAAAAYEAWKFPEDIQALTVENERLREENTRLAALSAKASLEASQLREALKPFARAAEYCEGLGDLDHKSVLVENFRAAAAAIREGGNNEN